MDKKLWHIDNFTTCFSAEAHDLLFEEMIFTDYVPGMRERMLVSVYGRLSEYTLTDSLVDLQTEGEKILLESAAEIVQSLEEEMITVGNIKIEGPLTVAGAEEVYKNLQEVLHLYGQIDTWYTEGLYDTAGALKQGREKAAKIIEASKNKLRGGLVDKTFFWEDGYFQRFLQVLSNQLEMPKKDILQYTKSELLELITGGNKISEDEIIARKKAYVFFGDGRECTLLTGTEAELFYQDFRKVSSELEQKDMLTGSVVYKEGIVTGEAFVLITNQEISIKEAETVLHNAEGKILVVTIADARMDVQYQRAKALIAEVGGLLSHAAIVAREFKVPCLVGVKNATVRIKTGDRIELDTNNGTVRILKSV
jgi:phosphohistidine swiveling domain-containing protein